MTQARTAGRRRRHDHEHPDIEDARDVEERAAAAVERAERRRWYRLMTPTATAWREVAIADDVNAAITLADLANQQVIVIDVRTAKRVYDNGKPIKVRTT